MKLESICNLACTILFLRTSLPNQDSDAQSTLDGVSLVNTASQCSICLGDYTNRDPKTLLCGHIYCSDCICRWLSVGDNTQCPMCRAVVTLSSKEIDSFESISLKFPPGMLNKVLPECGKSFISMPENTDIDVHAYRAFLKFCQEAVNQTATRRSAEYSIFPKEHLYELLRLANIHKLERTTLNQFVVNFNMSLAMLNNSEIDAFLIHKTSRENLMALLQPIFGQVVHDPEGKTFRYSGQCIRLYTKLQFIDTSNLTSLVIENCKIDDSTLNDIKVFLSAPNLQDVVFSHVKFNTRITGIRLAKLRSLKLCRISEDEDKDFVQSSLQELLSVSTQLVIFSVEHNIYRSPIHFIRLCLKQIGDLGCRLETLIVQGYYCEENYSNIFDTIFENSKSTLREISFVNHRLGDRVSIMGKTFNSLSCLEQLRTLEINSVDFNNSEVVGYKFCKSLKSLKMLKKLVLDLTSFDDERDRSKSNDIRGLPPAFKEFTNLEHLSLDITFPTDPKVLSALKEMLKWVKNTLVQLDITFSMSLKYKNGTPEIIRETAQMLRAQHAVKNLAIDHLHSISEDDAKILFAEISEIELDSLSFTDYSNTTSMNNGFFNALKPDAKIRRLRILTSENSGKYITRETGRKFASMNALTHLTVSNSTGGPSKRSFAEFLEGLSESTSITELHILYTGYNEWDEGMCNTFKKFPALESITFDDLGNLDEKQFNDFKARIARCLSDSNIAISYL